MILVRFFTTCCSLISFYITSTINKSVRVNGLHVASKQLLTVKPQGRKISCHRLPVLNHIHNSRGRMATDTKSATDHRGEQNDDYNEETSIRRSCTKWEDVQHDAIGKCVVPLSYDTHKGTSGGRIAIIGGNELYVGAPYFTSMAALSTGADLVSIYTAQEAKIPLKCYSPDFMVQPIYCATDIYNYDKQNDNKTIQCMIDQMVADVCVALQQRRIHCVVIGPGLGRQVHVLDGIAQIIQNIIQMNIYLVIDADALFLLSIDKYRFIIQGYNKVVITPNKVEYDRLFPPTKDDNGYITDATANTNINNRFQNVTIVQKGKYDIIQYNNKVLYICDDVGGMKRCGGIGDLLAGSIGTLLAWQCILSQSQSTTTTTPLKIEASSDVDTVIDSTDTNTKVALACYMACCIIKRATYKAFMQKRRTMSAQDIIQYIGPTMEEMISTSTTT